MPAGDPRAARIALAAAVGLVLADSSVVVLALPDIYRELDVSVAAVTWVLIGFNLVLAASAVPAAHAASRVGPARLTAAGLGLFAVASLACGLAPSIGVLIAARCLQAVGGAAAVCAALELMPAVYGSERCRHAGVGDRGRRRCRTRARRRRPAHRACLVAIDLPRPSPGGDSAGGPNHRSRRGAKRPGAARVPPGAPTWRPTPRSA